MSEEIKKPAPFSMDVIAYAGTPNGIPGDELNKNWGPLNKQLAFSNLSDNDILDIEDILRIRELKSTSSLRDYELRIQDQKGADQSSIISKCLSSLGRGGFLIKRATTASHEITNKTEESKKRFFGLGAPKQQPQQVQVQPQQGRGY
ncbi:MAG: hypothetical protein Q8910_02480 [Bacteroidota bacterium]|nr:hypothetical protein [Bacteroidota bacterium]